ncbi:MAG: efflux RND transporter periplasmic adaptor subunit [Luteimonas sp.]
MSTQRKSTGMTPRRIGITLAILASLATATWFWTQRPSANESSGYRTAQVQRGDIRVAISATGTLGAISTVDVGSQVSGQVTEVLADFNDRVQEGQVIARIDSSTFEAQIAQGAASVSSARANLATAQATLRNAQSDYARKSQLTQQQLVARSDADLARAARDQAQAQVAAAQAQITQQIASTRTSRLNLDRTVIRAPVDGVVLTRTVEPGQTVAASLQAPVLFQIAEDLSKMEIVLAIDEADIGQVKAGQAVSFNVDAFPDRQFRGVVQQVRLSATNTNNVITYPVVVTVDNADQALLPGLTVNAEIEVSRRDNVLQVPNTALRFKPAEEASAVGGAQAQNGQRIRGGGMANELPGFVATLQLTPDQQSVFDAAIAAVRERAAARQAPQQQPGSSGAGLFGGGRGGPGQQGGNRGGGNMDGAMRQRMQERFSQQFSAFRATLDAGQRAQWDAQIASLVTERRAPLYKLADGKPEETMVRVGAADGSNTEVSGNIAEGDVVIIGSERAASGQ